MRDVGYKDPQVVKGARNNGSDVVCRPPFGDFRLTCLGAPKDAGSSKAKDRAPPWRTGSPCPGTRLGGVLRFYIGTANIAISGVA